jgi:hypothetical protein
VACFGQLTDVFRKMNDLMPDVPEWMRNREGDTMKRNAFDDVQYPFDYKAELKQAREALNKKVVECVSRNWMIGYRDLAENFKISTGALYAIAKGQKPKLNPGPRRSAKARPR